MIKRQSVTTCNVRLKKRRFSAIRSLVAETLVLAKTHGYIEKIEDELERELQQDVSDPPEQKILRWRQQGDKIFKSKHVLLTVVILCVLDCALVLGELALDLYKIKASLEATEKLTKATELFISKMEVHHVVLVNRTTFDVFNLILDAIILWDMGQNSSTNFTTSVPCTELNSCRLPNQVHQSVNNSSTTYIQKAKQIHANNHELEIVGKMAHVCHYCSIAILALIMIEVFDAFVVVMSFLMDISFQLFLPDMDTKDFLFILAILLPWRVIRVVNSLIVSVKDHEHFRLKLLYKRKKKIQGSLKESEAMLQKYMSQVVNLQRLCIMEGIDERAVDNVLKSNENSVPPATPVKKKLKFKFDDSIFNTQSQNRATRCSVPRLDSHGLKPPKSCFVPNTSLPSFALSKKQQISRNLITRRKSMVAMDRYNSKNSNGDARGLRHVISENLGTMHEVGCENGDSPETSQTVSESSGVFIQVSFTDSTNTINDRTEEVELRHTSHNADDEGIKLVQLKEEAKRRHSESHIDNNNSFAEFVQV